MEKFNNTTLFTGYLKQLLHNFNLPKYRIYTKENERYHEWALWNNKLPESERPSDWKLMPEENVLETVTQYYDTTLNKVIYPNDIRYIPYIKDGTIQEYIDGVWYEVGDKGNQPATHVHHYEKGIKILNYTKNLKITTNAYDDYTHEYLGDYLRFKRDYEDIDLMPLYNCFSNKQCDSLNISFEVIEDVINKETGKIEKEGYTAKFNTNDAAYKIYMIPVKLFKDYTIAIDSNSQLEICCGLYGAYQDTRDKFKALPKMTYQRIASSCFSQPLLFTKLSELNVLTNKNLLIELAQNEASLKLFLKVPVTNESTIVILEGNYTDWNDRISDANAKVTYNRTVLNFEYSPEYYPCDLKSPLQLLRFNTKQQHPFADRLIEYLMGNVIDPSDEIINDVKRVQKVLKYRTAENYNGELPSGKRVFTYYYHPVGEGYWDSRMRYVIYDHMTTYPESYETNHDVLGYVDKDVEKYFKYYDTEINKNVSISDVELEEGERI